MEATGGLELLQGIWKTYEVINECIAEENIDLLQLHVPRLQEYINVCQQLSVTFEGNDEVQSCVEIVLENLKGHLFNSNQLLERDAQCKSKINVPVRVNGSVGRPTYDIPEQQIVMLKNSGLSWSKIAKIMNVSTRTLFNFRRGNQMENLATSIAVDDVELEQKIRKIKAEHPEAGYRYVWAALKVLRISATWERVIRHVKAIDPLGVWSRKRKRLVRRQYKVKGANYLW